MPSISFGEGDQRDRLMRQEAVQNSIRKNIAELEAEKVKLHERWQHMDDPRELIPALKDIDRQIDGWQQILNSVDVV